MKEETLPDKVIKILKEKPGEALKPRELAKIIFSRDKDYVEKKRKKGEYRRSDSEVITTIDVEISLKKFKGTPYIERLSNPIRFRFITNPEKPFPSPKNIAPSNSKPSEKDPHNPLEAKTLHGKVFILLRENPGKVFHPQQLAAMICERWPEYAKQKKENSRIISNDKELIKEICHSIHSYKQTIQKKDPNRIELFKPLKFRLTNNPSDSPLPKPYPPSPSNSKPSPESTQPLSEKELYDKLRIYLKSTDIHSMRIDERASSNTGGKKGNHWLHPDIVGIEVLSKKWIRSVQDCVKACHGKRVRLWSFEVKKDITRTNIRESYQQAVSNSSWANFGYLVAQKINPDTKEELNILFSLHGIGFIELNVENPKASQIIIRAKERPEIDWDMVNRIAKQNEPFEEHYVEKIKTIHQADSITWTESHWVIK